MSFKDFFNYRPLSVLAISAGIRDILVGIGFLVGWEQITRTLIFMNYNELIPGISGLIAGGLFIAVGLAVVISCIRYNPSWMSVNLKTQSLFWLFSTLMYMLNGHFLLAAIFGLFFMLPAGYSGFYVKYHPEIFDIVHRMMNGENNEGKFER